MAHVEPGRCQAVRYRQTRSAGQPEQRSGAACDRRCWIRSTVGYRSLNLLMMALKPLALAAGQSTRRRLRYRSHRPCLVQVRRRPLKPPNWESRVLEEHAEARPVAGRYGDHGENPPRREASRKHLT